MGTFALIPALLTDPRQPSTVLSGVPPFRFKHAGEYELVLTADEREIAR